MQNPPPFEHYILIIEDIVHEALALRQLLIDEGFSAQHIFMVGSVDEAMKLHLIKPFKLVFLDIKLRGNKEGYDFLREIYALRQAGHNVAIPHFIITTGNNDDYQREGLNNQTSIQAHTLNQLPTIASSFLGFVFKPYSHINDFKPALNLFYEKSGYTAPCIIFPDQPPYPAADILAIEYHNPNAQRANPLLGLITGCFVYSAADNSFIPNEKGSSRYDILLASISFPNLPNFKRVSAKRIINFDFLHSATLTALKSEIVLKALNGDLITIMGSTHRDSKEYYKNIIYGIIYHNSKQEKYPPDEQNIIIIPIKKKDKKDDI
jgi:CheY-like chemotaxis protein